MAAEKLTKARLAQILITLLVLISAFLWRTFSHESGTHITCGMEKPCQFDIEEAGDCLSTRVTRRSQVLHFAMG